MPSVEKPAASARRAYSAIPRRSTPRTAFGSPIPTSTACSLPPRVYRGGMPGATLDELEPWARELLDAARVGHLGLLDGDGAPRVLPVTFAVVAGAVWSAVDDKPKRRSGELARVRWLRARPSSALTVDRYDDDWSLLAWEQVLGRARIHPPDEEQEALAALSEKYEQYRAEPPPGPLIGIEPDRALSWRAR